MCTVFYNLMLHQVHKLKTENYVHSFQAQQPK